MSPISAGSASTSGTHLRWIAELDAPLMRALIKAGQYEALARKAVAIESRTNLLFLFEKMALRDAGRTPDGARAFSEGLFDFLHGRGSDESRHVRNDQRALRPRDMIDLQSFIWVQGSDEYE